MILSNTTESSQKAAEIVAAGGLIAYRTDTFYGLGADPLNRKAVTAIKTLKGREETKPILLLISDVDQADRFVKNRSKAYATLAECLWPGPLTIVGIAREALPEELTAGTASIGVRLPADEAVRSFLRACGGALTATSANPSGSAPARTAEQVADYFPAGIDLIIDAGEVTGTLPSTVVDAREGQPFLIREGAITQSELESHCQHLEFRSEDSQKLKATTDAQLPKQRQEHRCDK